VYRRTASAEVDDRRLAAQTPLTSMTLYSRVMARSFQSLQQVEMAVR